MQSKNILLAAVILVVIVLGAWFFMKSQNNQVTPATPTTTNPVVPSVSSGSATSENQVEENTVVVTTDGFSPKEIRIKAGGTVTWVNNDSVDHQVNSAPHPAHTDYPPLNTVGLLKPGEKKSLSFPATGTYKYHNHLNPSLFGSVVVE